jgi:hypothetical protein
LTGCNRSGTIKHDLSIQGFDPHDGPGFQPAHANQAAGDAARPILFVDGLQPFWENQARFVASTL